MSSFAKMTVAQLKEELKKKGLETSGVKKDLVERLEAAGGSIFLILIHFHWIFD
jgi:hypothetical protein